MTGHKMRPFYFVIFDDVPYDFFKTLDIIIVDHTDIVVLTVSYDHRHIIGRSFVDDTLGYFTNFDLLVHDYDGINLIIWNKTKDFCFRRSTVGNTDL